MPVLLEEVLRELQVRQGGVYLDGTVGAAGHSEAILSRFEDTRVMGLDKDSKILTLTEKRLRSYGGRIQLFNMDFRQMKTAVEESGCRDLNGIILDLGVSSFQLDTGERGFSFSHDGPLDMRMDPAGDLTAKDVVNNYSRDELKSILRRFGEEKQAGRIASAIVREREIEAISTTKRLSGIVAAVPGMGRMRSIHPATRTFQAIRIEVNDELNAIDEVLPLAVGLLAEGGRVVELMRRFPNMHGDLSANSGHNAMNRDPGFGAEFMDEFQDRLYFGTDICSPETPTPLVDLLLKFQEEKKISEEVFQKIAHVNAKKLLEL